MFTINASITLLSSFLRRYIPRQLLMHNFLISDVRFTNEEVIMSNKLHKLEKNYVPVMVFDVSVDIVTSTFLIRITQ